jgi:hypothetical protein
MEMIREDEVSLVLGKWQEEKTLLHVVARVLSGALAFDCRVIGFSTRSIGFDLLGEFDMCEIFITEFIFDYSEPRDVATSIAGTRQFKSGLIGHRGVNESLIIMEISGTDPR